MPSPGVLARGVLLVALLLGGSHAFAASAPILVRPTQGGRALEVDRIEDLVSLIARDYQILTPAETEAWQKRQQDQSVVDASLQQDAEHRGIVLLMAILLTVFVLGTFVLVYWIRNRSGLR